MKNKIIFSLTLLVLTFSNAKAETWGFLAGMNRWELKDDSGKSVTPDSKFSTQFGIALFNQSYPIELDILYTKKEVAEGQNETSLQFPVFYRANITKELRFGLGVFADYDTTDRPYSGRKNLDLGVAGSAQYVVPFGKALISFDARYLWGTTDLPGKSRDLSFLVGLLFK